MVFICPKSISPLPLLTTLSRETRLVMMVVVVFTSVLLQLLLNANIINNIIWNNTATGSGNDLYIDNDGNGDYFPSHSKPLQ